MKYCLLELTEIVAVVTTLFVSLAALCLSGYVFFETRRRRRRKLVNAIYHHARMAVAFLEDPKLAANNQDHRKKIDEQTDYMPLVVRTDTDNLTYDQIIEVMELLDDQEEQDVLYYFHHEADLHAYASSFDLEFVRRWPAERRLQLWEEYEKSQRKTLEYVKKTVDILGKRLQRSRPVKPTDR